MKHIFFLILLIVSMTALGQGYVILNNGQKIKFRKISEQATGVKIKEPGKKEKTEIRIGDMKGYFLEYEERMYFPREVTDSTLNKESQFMKKVMGGKINLYQKEVETMVPVSTPHGATYVRGTVTKTFIEKSNRLEFIMNEKDVFLNKKKKIKLLRSFVEDDTASMRTLDDVKFNYKNLLKIVKDYNVNTHTIAEEKGDGVNFGTIIFYRTGKDLTTNLVDRIKYSRKTAEDIHISICDSTYTLSDYSWIEIRVPSDRNLKVCFAQSNSGCAIISTNSYFPARYEVSEDKDSKLFTLTLKDFEASFEINKLGEYKPPKKRRG